MIADMIRGIQYSSFEKYIGGKYLGDLVSSALAALARDELFPFEPTFGFLQTAHVSMFEA